MNKTINEEKGDINIIDWKITTDCQCKCEFCYASDKVESINSDKYAFLVNCIKKLNCKKVCITGGEPLLNKYISNILELLYQNEIRITLSTNGLRYNLYKDLIEKYVNRLSLPLDGYDSLTNSCNGRPRKNFDYIFKILENNNKIDKKMDIKIATVLTKRNANLEHFKKMYEKLSRYNISQWKIYELIYEGKGYDNRDNLSVDLDSIKEVIDFFEEINNQKFKVDFVYKNSRNKAYFMIQPNADVIIPTEDQNGVFQNEKIGNLLTESVEEISSSWKSLIDIGIYKKNCSRRIL